MSEQADRLREQVARAQIAAAQSRADAAALDIPSAMDEAAVLSGNTTGHAASMTGPLKNYGKSRPSMVPVTPWLP